MTVKPVIFISSTVYDFADMRSALKFYYEERGCRVLLSEYADFDRHHGVHSYDACLRTIESADLYVLLIGERRGTWFDKANKITVTQQEYRHAYSLAEKKQIKIASFVRKNVYNRWGEAKRTVDSSSVKIDPGIDDQDHCFQFIDEVGKILETDTALNGNCNLPRDNWMIPFMTFDDVVRGIDSSLRVNDRSVLAVHGQLVEQELLENLQALCFTSEETRTPIASYSFMPDSLWKLHKSSRSEVRLTAKDVWGLKNFILVSAMENRLKYNAVKSAVYSGVFLEYSKYLSQVKATKVHELMCDLLRRRQMMTGDESQLAEERSLVFQLEKDRDVTLTVDSVLHTVARSFAHAEIQRLMIVLIMMLRDCDVPDGLLSSRPWSPLEGVDEGCDMESPTINEMSVIIDKMCT